MLNKACLISAISRKIGFKLMMDALAPNDPKIKLTDLNNDSEKDE